MKADDFNMLLDILVGPDNKLIRATLQKWRKKNPCDGLAIKPPFPFSTKQFHDLCTNGQGKIDQVNRHTLVGRQILLDYIDHKSSGFHVNDRPGNVAHWKSRPEYQKVTKSQFWSQALEIAKDVKLHIPDDVEIAKMFEKAQQDIKQQAKQIAKLRSSKKNKNKYY